MKSAGKALPNSAQPLGRRRPVTDYYYFTFLAWAEAAELGTLGGPYDRQEMNIDQIRTLFAYNKWANARILDAAAQVKVEDYTRELGASHGSLRGTLFHIVFGEWDWLHLWLGDSWKEIAQKEPPPEAFPDIETLRSAWSKIVRDEQAFIDTLNDDVLIGLRSFDSYRGEPWELSLAETMQHVLTHSSYHRGQAVTLLRQLGHTPPCTDFLIFLLEERQRRTA